MPTGSTQASLNEIDSQWLKATRGSAERQGVRFLRDPRACLEGLGTASLLVIGGLIVLVTVSSLVGFSDWGEADRSDDVGDVVIGDPAGPPAASLDLDALAARTARAAAPGRRGDAAGVAGNRSLRIPREGEPRPRTGSDLRDGGSSQPRDGLQPVAVESPAPSAPAPGDGGPVRNITRGVADTTEQATGELGRTVGNVDPALGKAVGGLGNVLGDTVRGPGAL